MLFPDNRVSAGYGVLSGCDALEVLVLQSMPLFYRRCLEHWAVTHKAQIILYTDLRLAHLFAEFTAADTSPERKELLRREIGRCLEKMRRRNKLKTNDPLRKNLLRVTHAIRGDSKVGEATSVPTPEEPVAEASAEDAAVE